MIKSFKQFWQTFINEAPQSHYVEATKTYSLHKDLSEYYAERIGQSLDIIDELYYAVEEDPSKIRYLNHELHKLFKRIYPKMQKHKLDKDILRQREFNIKFKSAQPLTYIREQDDESGSVVNKLKRSSSWDSTIEILEDREMHLMLIMEEMGMLAKEVRKERHLQ